MQDKRFRKAKIPNNYPTGPENYIIFLGADVQIGGQVEINNQRIRTINITS